MDSKKPGVNTRNWVVSVQEKDYWRAFVNKGIEPSGSISYRVVTLNLSN